jgi:hypothetical protein
MILCFGTELMQSLYQRDRRILKKSADQCAAKCIHLTATDVLRLQIMAFNRQCKGPKWMSRVIFLTNDQIWSTKKMETTRKMQQRAPSPCAHQNGEHLMPK